MIYKQRQLRHEMKYLVNRGVYEILSHRLSPVMKRDIHSETDSGEYRVTSLYFDDLYRSAYNDKLCGIMTRKKYRIRSYNLSKDNISLECKFKDSDMVSKRSVALTYEQYQCILHGDLTFGFAEKFADTAMEELCFSASSVGMKPYVVVDYFREAYINREGNVRITFDKNLSTTFNTLDMLSPDAKYSPVLDGYYVLEVKYDDYIPSYIEELLTGLPLSRDSISKFLICTDKLNSVRAY